MRTNNLQKQMRRENREAKEAERFRAPMTGKRARHVAKAQAGAEYNPVLRSIRSEAKGSVKRQKDEKRWYGQLADEIAGRSANGAAATKAAGDAINSQLATVGAQDSQHLAQLSADNKAFADLVGGPTNEGGIAQAAAGATARRQQAVALNSPLVGIEANRSAQLGGLATATRMRGREAVTAERSRRDKILEDLRSGMKQKGQAYVGRLNELREGAVKDHQTDLAFGLESQEARNDARHDRATEATAARNAATSERNASTSERNANIAGRNARTSERGENRQQRESKNKPKGGPTQSQKYAQQQELRNAIATGKGIVRRLSKGGGAIDWGQVEQLLEFDYDGVAVAKAVRKLKAQYG